MICPNSSHLRDEEEVKGEKAECKGGSFWQKPDNWNVRAGSSIDKEKVTKQTKSLKLKKDPLGNPVRRKKKFGNDLLVYGINCVILKICTDCCVNG